MSHEIENFFGVYLLYNVNPKFKGRTYIGFTVNPSRRVNQHNKGQQAGGARRTSGKGPWDMVLIIHGFPNTISALRFEWAWQNPKRSRRLRHLAGKRKSEDAYTYAFRVVSEMLRTSPWSRLPLTIRWLKQHYQLHFPPHLAPPTHMPLQYGPVIAKKAGPQSEDPDSQDPSSTQPARIQCSVCKATLNQQDNTLRCVRRSCDMQAHTLCLGRAFVRGEGCGGQELLPVRGSCPGCDTDLLWGDLIRHKAGCYQQEDVDMTGMEEHWADQM